MNELIANRPKTRDRVPKLVPVGLEKKITKASCPERLGGAHNLQTGHLVREETETSVSERKRQLIYYLVREETDYGIC
jgi:hypothetical protein